MTFIDELFREVYSFRKLHKQDRHLLSGMSPKEVFLFLAKTDFPVSIAIAVYLFPKISRKIQRIILDAALDAGVYDLDFESTRGFGYFCAYSYSAELMAIMFNGYFWHRKDYQSRRARLIRRVVDAVVEKFDGEKNG